MAAGREYWQTKSCVPRIQAPIPEWALALRWRRPARKAVQSSQCAAGPLPLTVHERARHPAERCQQSLDDALICASARKMDAEVPYTEGVQDDLVPGRLQVRNLFVRTPDMRPPRRAAYSIPHFCSR